MLEIKQLCSIRDERILFDDLSFSITPGDLVQIEGPNGAGKTTLLRIIAGLGIPETGEVFWNNLSISRCREQYHSDLLFLGHNTGVKPELTAFENLSFYQKIHSMTDDDLVWQALAYAGLAGREDMPAAQLSAGQTRRVALARLWLTKAKLWILDEPLTAIDKHGVKILEKLFLQHAKQGGMVIFTTHQDMLTQESKLRRIKLETVHA